MVNVCGDVGGHDPGGRLGENPGLGDGAGPLGDIAQRVHAGKAGREVALVDRDPAIGRKPEMCDYFRRAVEGDPDEQVVWHAPATRQPGRALASV